MSIRIFLFQILCCIAVCVFAQENVSGLKRDSLKIILNENLGSDSPIRKSFTVEEDIPEIKSETENFPKVQEIKLHSPFYIPYYVNPSTIYYGDYSTGGTIAHNLYGYGSQSTLSGIGRINEASLMYRYFINDFWEIQTGVNAIKYNFPFSIGQSFGATGAILYRPADKLTIKAFGSYAPASAYGFHMNSFGGTISYEFNDNWGMEVGAERRYDPMKRKWDTRPIAIPYYKFNKTKIGVDVGGIIYEIIRSAKYKNQRGNPTIMPGR